MTVGYVSKGDKQSGFNDSGCHGGCTASCNRCSGCGGDTLDLGHRSSGCGSCYDHSHCVSWPATVADRAALYCSTSYGTVSAVDQVPNTQNWDTGVNVVCTFSSIDMSQFTTGGQFNDQLGFANFTSSSWRQAKNDYCIMAANIDSTECQGWFNTFGTAACQTDVNQCANTSYNTAKLNVCNTPANIITPSCITTIDNIMKSGLQSEQTAASGMVDAYCQANPNATQCGCYNVTTYGSLCLNDDTKKTIAGCRNIYADYESYQGIANALIANKFCTSDDCMSKAWMSNAQFLPAARAPATTCPNIQACIQDFRGANFNQSQVSAECKNTLNLGGGTPSTTTPGPPAAGLPDASSSASSSASVVEGFKFGDTVISTRQAEFGGGGVCLLCCCCCSMFMILAIA